MNIISKYMNKLSAMSKLDLLTLCFLRGFFSFLTLTSFVSTTFITTPFAME